MNSIAPTQKILTFMSYTGECHQQKHTQHAPSTKTECDYLNGWIEKTVTYTQGVRGMHYNMIWVRGMHDNMIRVRGMHDNMIR